MRLFTILLRLRLSKTATKTLSSNARIGEKNWRHIGDRRTLLYSSLFSSFHPLSPLLHLLLLLLLFLHLIRLDASEWKTRKHRYPIWLFHSRHSMIYHRKRIASCWGRDPCGSPTIGPVGPDRGTF